jgi:predicted dehydrogenase
MKVALIGYGYWGKKIYKTLIEVIAPKNIIIVEPKFNKEQNELKINTLKEVLADSSISQVFIATPEETHFEIAKACLEKGKHVFVEKPLCLIKDEAVTLHNLADLKKLKLYSDYIFLFDPYIRKIKELIDNNYIGELNHIESIRHSTNISKPNITVIDDLAIHDIYLGNFFYKNKITKSNALKSKILDNIVNQAFVKFHFDEKILTASYSWAHPRAQRIMTFFGSTKTIIWNKNIEEILIFENEKMIKKIAINLDVSPLKLSIKKFLSNHLQANYINDIEIIQKLDLL